MQKKDKGEKLLVRVWKVNPGNKLVNTKSIENVQRWNNIKDNRKLRNVKNKTYVVVSGGLDLLTEEVVFDTQNYDERTTEKKV